MGLNSKFPIDRGLCMLCKEMVFTSESPVCPNAVKTVSDPIFQQTLRVNAIHDLYLLCEALLSHSLEFRPVCKRFRAGFEKKKSGLINTS